MSFGASLNTYINLHFLQIVADNRKWVFMQTVGIKVSSVLKVVCYDYL